MSEETKKEFSIWIDDVEYKEDDFNQEQKVMITHIQDLSVKSQRVQFELEQLNVSKQAFVNLLKQSLDKTDEEEAA